MLTRRVDSPGPDLTGLAGIYDFSIDLSGLGFNGNPPLKERTVLQFSRRFKMTFHKAEGAKHPVEILGIDHIERTPKEN